jgi:hypothetical protein
LAKIAENCDHNIGPWSQSFFKKYIFVANAFISPFNTQTMHIKSVIHNSTAMYVSLKTLYPGGIRTLLALVEW